MGRTLAKQLDLMYDAHSDSILERKAGYVMDAQCATVWFEVDGKPVSSICEYPLAYALPDGSWMIPQPELRACTYACEEMLLAEGKSKAEVLEQFSDPCSKLRPGRGSAFSRREPDDVCDSLEQRSGCKPVVIEGDGLTSQDVIQNLKAGLAAHGPCIFEVNDHARILDAIEETADGLLLTVRDPFSATVLKIKPHETFWTRRMEGDPTATKSRKWDAIFLPKKQP